MPAIYYPLQGVQPAKSPWLAKTNAYALAVGGVVGTGAPFPQGQAIGLVGGVAISETRLLTISLNGATGYTLYFTYITPGGNYFGATATGGVTANASTSVPTSTQVYNALVATIPGWANNVTVSGPISNVFTINWTNLMANRRIGGLLTCTIAASTGGTPTAAITTSQQGSAGAGQADIYSQAGVNNVCGILQYPFSPDAYGSEPTEFGNPAQVTMNVTAYTKGYFYLGATGSATNPQGAYGAVGIDANAMTFKNLGFEVGQNVTDVGAMIQLF